MHEAEGENTLQWVAEDVRWLIVTPLSASLQLAADDCESSAG